MAEDRRRPKQTTARGIKKHDNQLNIPRQNFPKQPPSSQQADMSKHLEGKSSNNRIDGESKSSPNQTAKFLATKKNPSFSFLIETAPSCFTF